MFLCTGPATKYEFTIRGFTKKREGIATVPIVVKTDTTSPSPPEITNVTCVGKSRDHLGDGDNDDDTGSSAPPETGL